MPSPRPEVQAVHARLLGWAGTSGQPIGTTDDGTPWIATALNDDGFPLNLAPGLAALTVFAYGTEWSASDNSAKWPKVGVFVDAQAGVSNLTAQWLAENVAQAVIDELDDPARRNTGRWTPDVWVLGCRRDGSMIGSRYETERDKWRVEIGFEIQTL